MLAFFKLVPIRDWLYIASALALLSGYAWWTHHQRALGEARCEARHEAEQKTIADLQSQLDARAAAQNAPVLARYNALDVALSTYDPTPISVAGCSRLPDDVVRAVNAAHARPKL